MKDNKIPKEVQDKEKRDHYLSIMSQLINVNSTISNSTNNLVSENIDTYNEKHKKSKINNKNSENQESKFSISHLKDKSENLETHKKGFFHITEELKEDEDDMSLKLKRDIVVEKLMFDKSIIIDHEDDIKFTDEIKASIYLSLSRKSRKAILHDCSDENHNHEETFDFNMFHRLIGMRVGENDDNSRITNMDILNLSQKLIESEDCMYYII